MIFPLTSNAFKCIFFALKKLSALCRTRYPRRVAQHLDIRDDQTVLVAWSVSCVLPGPGPTKFYEPLDQENLHPVCREPKRKLYRGDCW